MNTLDRPLFRQMGGPAQMMPQDAMVPDDAMMAVNEAEMAGAQVGQEYLEGTMQSLDQAETPKDVIDAIRGNQQPLETRYQELAGLVGEEDARQTPETVLALVQPTIMMTEQGAMDTGIAQLMQQMVGDVDMGADSEMGQGVGSLMMAGASEAPAPQNFKQGGAVAYLANGSDDSGTVPAGIGISTLMEQFAPYGKPPSSESVAGYYESLLPMYQKILGEDEEAKRARQSGTFFDIAQAGLNLAAGVDPRTGRSTAGMPFASQLAAAASQLPAQISARDAERRTADRALKASALQTAMQQAQGESTYQAGIATSLAKEMFDTKDPKTVQLEYLYKDGDVLTFDRSLGPDVAAQVQTKLNEGWSPITPPDDKGLGGSRVARAYTLLSDPKNLTALEQHFAGDTSEQSNLAGSAYSILTTPERDPVTGFISTAILPENIKQAVTRGKAQATETPETPVETETPETPVETETPVEMETPLTARVNMELATGLPSGPKAVGAFLIASAADVFDVPYRPDQGDSTRASRRALGALNLEIEQFILDDQGRPLSNEFATIQQMLAQPSMFQDDEDAFRKIVSLRDHVATQKRIGETIVSRAKSGGFTGTEVSNQNVRIIKAEEVLKVLDGAIDSYDRSYGQQSVEGPRVEITEDLINLVRNRGLPVQ